MARKKDDIPAPVAPAKPKAKASAKKGGAKSEAPSPGFKGRMARHRGRAAAVMAVALLLAWAASEVWRRVAPTIAARPRFLIAAERITVNPPPDWTTADVRSEVIHNGALDGRLSILEPSFAGTIENAFALHPWVESVERIEKRPPNGVHVELTYRRPVAAIESPGADGVAQLLPVDRFGVFLPPADVPNIRLQYLPRITNVVGQPAPGQRWDDPRVAGAVSLALLLADEWRELHLFEIAPSARPVIQIRGDARYFNYELLTRGGTRIVWGPPPHEPVPGEDHVPAKLERLKQSARDYGPFDSDAVTTPAVIDLRNGISVTPRTVQKPDGDTRFK